MLMLLSSWLIILILLSLIFPQVIRCMPYDKTVDYFSLGIILFEMAFSNYPFSDSDVSNSILNDLPDYPKDADPDLVALLKKVSTVTITWKIET